MNDGDILLVGGIVAVIAAGIDLWKAKGYSATAWGVMALGLAAIFAFLNH